MSVFRYEIPLAITLQSPFVTRGLAPDRATIDTPLARDAAGRFILPGTLIQGVIRAALLEMVEHLDDGVLQIDGGTHKLLDVVGALFGRGSDEGRQGVATVDGWKADNTPDRGLLSVADLTVIDTSKPAEDDGVLTRIQIDPGLGSVREGFLQVIELPYAHGERVAFGGRAHLRAGKLTADLVRALIERALALVPAIGAIKSAGFGKVVGIAVDDPQPVAWQPAAVAEAVQIALRYTVDRPFVVGASRVGGNLFRGQAVIPGAAIKGTLAQALKDAGCLDQMNDFLADLTITHGFPRKVGKEGAAWQPMPRSLALAKPLEDKPKPLLTDRLLTSDDSGRIDGKLHSLAFAVDWKGDEDEQVAACLHEDCPPPGYDVRTRTKIDPETGTAAYDDNDPDEEGMGQLFSYSAVRADEHEWHGRLVLPENADPAHITTILGLLAAGIIGFGKTAARLMAWQAGADHGLPPIQALPVAPGDQRFAVTLMTPALLNDVGSLRDGRPLFEDYRAYWQELGFRLLDLCAGQRIEGGYVALRYPQRSDRYEPYLLTEPGSVFLIEPDAGADLLPLLKTGLAPNKAIARRRWDQCPFLAENGFGMIRCNRIDHHGLAVKPRGLAA